MSVPAPGHPPRIRPLQPGQHPQQRALARPVRPSRTSAPPGAGPPSLRRAAPAARRGTPTPSPPRDLAPDCRRIAALYGPRSCGRHTGAGLKPRTDTRRATRHESHWAGQPEHDPHPAGGRARVPLLLAARSRQDHRRREPPAGQPEDPARERAAVRGRQHLQGRRRPRHRRLGQGRQLRPRSAVPARPHPDAGFHRRPRRRRPGRHARRHHRARRLARAGEPAGPGRPRDRPLRHGRRLRHP